MQLNPHLKRKLLITKYGTITLLKLIALDQISKWWIINFLKQKPGFVHKVTSFFDLVYVWNYGISFGLFKEYYQYSNIAFGIFNSIIVIYLCHLLLNSRSYLAFTGYSLIIGGALGNLIDRLFRGAVFDFIFFHYKGFGLFIFNLADSFISIGVMVIVYDFYRNKKTIEAPKINAYDDLESEAEKIRQISDKFENSRR